MTPQITVTPPLITATVVTGTKFLCSEVIAPVKSEVDDIRLYVINFEDLTNPSSPLDERGNNRLSKCKYL
ncbi:unnamed protein product [Nezara viridula]|uniref:Uncharacterized protein n=1 Tax=Nezara viridula TaxID=85310 RepID=A0A9P0MW32_NEZVI|nr:unnamed protein product [Nezara viridula]